MSDSLQPKDEYKPTLAYTGISRKPTSLLKHLISLRVSLSTGPMSFVTDFLYLEGVDKLEKVMIKLAPIQKEEGEVREQLIGELLRCLRVIMNIDVSLTIFALYRRH